MDSLSITIKTVSPMFASNNGKDFDLTSQTVRGVMRFWYRAVVPRVINIYHGGKFKALKEAENLLFGSTDRKSSFDLIVDYNPSYGQYVSYKGIRLPAFASNKYAIYGIDKRKNYLDSNSNIVFDFVIKVKENTKEIKQLIQDLIVFISFVGGFGAKSRKGFGSFEVTNVMSPLKLSESLNKLSESIKKFLEKFDGFEFMPTHIPGNSVPDYPMFAKGYSYLIESPKRFSNFKEIYSYLYRMNENKDLSGLYIRLKDELRKHTPMEMEEKTLTINHNKKEITIDSFRKGVMAISKGKRKEDITFYQSMMGLPILYNHGKIQLKSRKNPRKASPVFISVHKDKNKKYFIRFVILYSKLYNHDNGILNPDLMFGDLEVKGSEEFQIVKEKISELAKKGGK